MNEQTRDKYEITLNKKEVQIGGEKLDEKTSENFAILEKAIGEKVAINCLYRGINFSVKPLKPAYFDGFWYLLLLDRKADDEFKKFSLKFIDKISLANDKFTIPSEFVARLKCVNSIWFNLILLSPYIVNFFRDGSVGDIMGGDKDGSVDLWVEYSHEFEIITSL